MFEHVRMGCIPARYDVWYNDNIVVIVIVDAKSSSADIEFFWNPEKAQGRDNAGFDF